MQVKIKKLSTGVPTPKYSKPGDAGLDLVATSIDTDNEFVEYGTSLAIEIPDGYVGLLYPRSSVSKTSLSLCNSVGVIDSSYRGEIKVRFNEVQIEKHASMGVMLSQAYIAKSDRPIYKVGDRVAQLVIMPYPQIELVEADDLSSTKRGDGGFGSSGV